MHAVGALARPKYRRRRGRGEASARLKRYTVLLAIQGSVQFAQRLVRQRRRQGHATAVPLAVPPLRSLPHRPDESVLPRLAASLSVSGSPNPSREHKAGSPAPAPASQCRRASRNPFLPVAPRRRAAASSTASAPNQLPKRSNARGLTDWLFSRVRYKSRCLNLHFFNATDRLFRFDVQ